MLIPKTEYIRSEKYLRHVRGQPCLSCGMPGEAHHVNIAMKRGVGLKVGDNWVVPLCHPCHMDLHHVGNEAAWWAIKGVDPVEWARESWERFNDEQVSNGR
jgi:hypothetical protein